MRVTGYSYTHLLRNIESAWVKDQNVLIENNSIQGYKVNLAITFVLEKVSNQPSSERTESTRAS